MGKINLFDSNPYNGHSFMNDLKKEFDKNITPKEKAKELVDRYERYSNPYYYGPLNFGPHFSEEEKRKGAKRCALIAVDEIIIALNFHQWKNTKQIDYYIEVRQEIEKL